MAATEYTRLSSASAGIFGNTVAKLRSAIDDWRARRDTHIALSQLSDRELEDIGLSRGDIDRVARGY